MRPNWKRRVVLGRVDFQYWRSRMGESNCGCHQVGAARSNSSGRQDVRREQRVEENEEVAAAAAAPEDSA